MKSGLPTLSVIIVNRNSAAKLDRSLASLAQQDYPRDLMEVLVIDAGSTDDSAEVVRQYGHQFIDGGYPENQEARRFLGIKRAKNDIIVSIDSDNYLPDPGWMRSMVAPLVEDPEIFAVETVHYAYRRSDALLNRYFSLFGVNDPVAFYLNKADRMPHYGSGWKLLGRAEDKGAYFKVTFGEELPTVGCNGFLIRRSVVDQVLDVPENFFHTDVIWDLVRRGHNKMAFVKTAIIHDTSNSLRHLIGKRISYFREHSVKLKERRRYHVFDAASWKDRLNLLKFAFYAGTFIKPLFDAARGFVRRPDVAWFMHPIVCFSFLIAYGASVILPVARGRG